MLTSARTLHVVALLWLCTGGGVLAQSALPQPFAAPALARAVQSVGSTSPQDRDWNLLAQHTGRQVEVLAEGAAATVYHLISADASGLVVSDLPITRSDAHRITLPRSGVDEVRLLTGKRKSKLGAVVGTLLGAVAGLGVIVLIANKDCGGNCSDESLLAIGSVVGLPLVGGIALYEVAGTPIFTTVYRR
jgi:hypothetical protein